MKQIPEDASLRRMENEEEDTQIYFVDKSVIAIQSFRAFLPCKK